jgi:hypothetical protein
MRKSLRLTLIVILFSISTLSYSQLSPYGTGFNVGTKEDLEIRLEWSKKDPCFDPGFSKNTKEYIELMKYRKIQSGPNGKQIVCERKK